MSDYGVQINVKVGDHLINITGDTVDEAMERLSVLALVASDLHDHLSVLDGRPATEVVQKEKQWGARSQGGRSYPKPSGGGSWGGNKGGGSGGWQKPAPAVAPDDLPDMYKTCPQHGVATEYKPAGQNKATGKPFSARVQCPTQGCDSTVWQNKDGSWG